LRHNRKFSIVTKAYNANDRPLVNLQRPTKAISWAHVGPSEDYMEYIGRRIAFVYMKPMIITCKPNKAHPNELQPKWAKIGPFLAQFKQMGFIGPISWPIQHIDGPV